MANVAVKVELTNEERKELESLRRSRKTALARRAALEAEGLTNKEAKLKMTAATAGKWHRRFAERRLDSLRDELRPGAPRRDGDIAGVIRRTRSAAGRRPMEPALHVQSGGLRPSTIHRIRRAFRLKPHRSETLSKDPPFVEKARDGLYLDPPERAPVLNVDEKSQMQALDRVQPLPMRPGQAEGRTHDYKRDGTTSLFAALGVATGKVIGKCRRSEEFRKFLDYRNVPSDIHIVMDNYAARKTEANWFVKRPRWHVHYAPSSASWINQLERFFGLLTEKRLRRGVRRSTADRERGIHSYAVNDDPKPFRRVKSADEIPTRRFCRRTLETSQVQAKDARASESGR